ncbi:MAG: AAA family ATPase [Candidatus Micrarchaeota archaeon]|nr:AAA family ATPase [Candidatus Micrarchaeota archaeon]
MPRIRKLKLHGFKSFAKKTVITFPANYSVICGANGSGKSNVLDAVCFVLGRISAKSLRADRMKEVIYHGWKNKKPSEFAEVSITFDNSDGIFPVDDKEVVVSRRINRKGISIYKLNGKTVTREKVLEILGKAGIRPDGYNIILQGDVTDIIEMSPLERRTIIDEISGISEYEEKRKKAERELSTVEERLKEVRIRLNERFTVLEKLRQEAEAAERYQKLSKELEVLRASLAKIRLEEADESMKKLVEKLDELEKEGEKIETEFSRAESELDEAEKKLRDFESKVFASVTSEKRKKAEKLKSDLISKKERLRFIAEEKSRLKNLIEKLSLIVRGENRVVREITSLGRTGVYGSVSSLITVPEKYRIAVEVAGGNHLNDIVVKNTDVALELINYLKSRKLGRATFLPLDKIKPRPESKAPEGSLGMLLDFVEFDEKYRPAISFVLGDTVLVEKIEDAKKIGIGKWRFVSLDGDLAEKSGAIIGGFYRPEKSFELSEISKYSKRIEELEEEEKNLRAEIVELEKNLPEPEEDFSDMEEERKKLVEEVEKKRKIRRELYEKRTIIQSNINRLRIQKARLEAELENLKLEFRNYQQTETVKMEPEVMENRISQILSELRDLGPVNMKAVEEYKLLKKDYDELKKKVEKLEDERERILELMMDIERKRRNVFMETLRAVSEQFKKVFRDLTGGEAELRLEDPESLESGLIIEASPKGKKLMNIDAMSGGEKTLTALAFLFALQRFRPAPFYILDEVDAALDKANTKKINELIKKYSEESQFIVISHNDTTIQSADCVFGVTMEEGESKIVGIKMP